MINGLIILLTTMVIPYCIGLTIYLKGARNKIIDNIMVGLLGLPILGLIVFCLGFI